MDREAGLQNLSFARRRKRSNRRSGLCLATLLFISGCGGAADLEALSGVRIDLSVDPGGIDACRIERVARIDQNATPLYMLRGEASYSAANHPMRRIPVQIQFRRTEGVVTDRAVTLTDLPVDCAEVSVEIVIEECISIERSDTACPRVEVGGQEAFASVRWTVEG